MKRLYKETLIAILEIALVLGLCATFIGVHAIHNIALQEASRTMAIIILVFCGSILILFNVYGGYKVGEEKSKPIIYSLGLASAIASFITYIVLMIMNTNPNNNPHFTIEHLEMLLLTIILQVIVIVFFAYLGNYVYFKNSAPSRVVIINNKYQDVAKIERYIKQYGKQYILTNVIDYHEGIDITQEDVDIYVSLNAPITFVNSMIAYAYEQKMRVYYNADFQDVLVPTKYDIFDDILMVSVDFQTATAMQMMFKRILDITIALIGIVITSPIMIIVAIAIKADDRGPVFYKQKRLTRNGEVFEVIKFRSMKMNSGNKPAMKNDVRITKVGRIIRKLRIDELPQFFNVLKSDMSIVGPRPESQSIIEGISKELPEFRYRLCVKAGLTGYAQIYGKYNTAAKNKLLLDLNYIGSYSAWNDIKLIFLTLTVFFKKDSTEGYDE